MILMGLAFTACSGQDAAVRGGQDSPSSGDEQGAAAFESGDASGNRLPTLDYGPEDPVDGFVRFEGSCTTFPYNLQHPEGWEMKATGGYAISKTPADDAQFIIRIEADHGSVHAANLERTVISRRGAEEVGRIEVGGHDVRVLGVNGEYVLHTQHGIGGTLHAHQVASSLSLEETLRILDTLEPLKEC